MCRMICSCAGCDCSCMHPWYSWWHVVMQNTTRCARIRPWRGHVRSRGPLSMPVLRPWRTVTWSRADRCHQGSFYATTALHIKFFVRLDAEWCWIEVFMYVYVCACWGHVLHMLQVAALPMQAFASHDFQAFTLSSPSHSEIPCILAHACVWWTRPAVYMGHCPGPLGRLPLPDIRSSMQNDGAWIDQSYR